MQLIDELDFQAHFSKDANFRSALLLGWLIAFNDPEIELLPVTFSKYRGLQSTQEGSKMD